MPREQIINRPALTLGYAGVYGSFLLHAEQAAKRFGVSEKEILLEVGRRKAVGGQEDMIVEVGAELAGLGLGKSPGDRGCPPDNGGGSRLGTRHS
jgi:4-hydroxy 2-oxovalerate aldolase